MDAPTRQTLYREHQALRFGYSPRSAVEEKRDIVDQCSARHDDYGGDRKRGEGKGDEDDRGPEPLPSPSHAWW